MSLHDDARFQEIYQDALRALEYLPHLESYPTERARIAERFTSEFLTRHPEAAPVSICDPCACVGPLSPGLHVRPQLQVQAPVGEGLENGASGEERRWMIATLDAVDVEHDFDSGDIPSTTTYVDALLAAGYRKPTLPSVEDVKAWALKEFGVSNGTQVWIEFQGDPDKFTAAVLDLLKRGA